MNTGELSGLMRLFTKLSTSHATAKQALEEHIERKAAEKAGVLANRVAKRKATSVERGVIDVPGHMKSRNEHPAVRQLKVVPRIKDQTYQDLVESQTAGQSQLPEDDYTSLKRVHRDTIQGDLKSRDTVYESNERHDDLVRSRMDDQLRDDENSGKVAFELTDPEDPKGSLGPLRYADAAAKAILALPPEQRAKALTDWLKEDATKMGEDVVTKAATETTDPVGEHERLEENLPNLMQVAKNRTAFHENVNLNTWDKDPKNWKPSRAMRESIPEGRKPMVSKAISVALRANGLPERMTAQKLIGTAMSDKSDPMAVQSLHKRLTRMVDPDTHSRASQKDDRVKRVAEHLEGRPHRQPRPVMDGSKQVATITPQQEWNIRTAGENRGIMSPEERKKAPDWKKQQAIRRARTASYQDQQQAKGSGHGGSGGSAEDVSKDPFGVTSKLPDYVKEAVRKGAGKGVGGPSYETPDNANILLTAHAIEKGKMRLDQVTDKRTRQIVKMILREKKR